MVVHIKNTKTTNLRGVYFEDIDELVSNKNEAWLVNFFLFRYFSTKKAADKFTS